MRLQPSPQAVPCMRGAGGRRCSRRAACMLQHAHPHLVPAVPPRAVPAEWCQLALSWPAATCVPACLAGPSPGLFPCLCLLFLPAPCLLLTLPFAMPSSCSYSRVPLPLLCHVDLTLLPCLLLPSALTLCSSWWHPSRGAIPAHCNSCTVSSKCQWVRRAGCHWSGHHPAWPALPGQPCLG